MIDLKETLKALQYRGHRPKMDYEGHFEQINAAHTILAIAKAGLDAADPLCIVDDIISTYRRMDDEDFLSSSWKGAIIEVLSNKDFPHSESDAKYYFDFFNVRYTDEDTRKTGPSTQAQIQEFVAFEERHA